MRWATPSVAILVLVAFAPLGSGATGHGTTVGADAGIVAPGLWDVWQFNHGGGSVAIDLSWGRLAPWGADHDLHVYPKSALNDGAFTPNERIAASMTRTLAPHVEHVTIDVPAGAYYVVVVPVQAQGESYTLTTSTGGLWWAGTAVGYVGSCPGPFCPGPP